MRFASHLSYRFAGILTLLCMAPLALADGTVTLDVSSSRDGKTVAPGSTIDWMITFDVSTGDNAGLALLAVDFMQDAGNPATLDIPPADAVPAALSNFSRPDGISNPGEGSSSTGYVGVQRGTAGAMNLKQIGGGQNTFGVAGSSMGTQVNVVGGVRPERRGHAGPGLVRCSGDFRQLHLPHRQCGRQRHRHHQHTADAPRRLAPARRPTAPSRSASTSASPAI